MMIIVIIKSLVLINFLNRLAEVDLTPRSRPKIPWHEVGYTKQKHFGLVHGYDAILASRCTNQNGVKSRITSI